MRAYVISFAALLAVSAFAQTEVEPCSQSPAGATRYVMILAGNRAGQQTTWQADDGYHACFEFNDRGRGPLTRTQYRLSADGIPTFVETHGNDYLKGPADESFSGGGGSARWKNKAEQGSSAAPGFYVSMFGPPDELAMLARALLKAPGQKLPLLPGGEARLEKVASATVSNGDKSQEVTDYAISGLGFSPAYIWLDSDKQMFAQVSGWSSITREGWESSAKQLDEIQDKLDDARYAELARKLAHKPAGALVIRHARLFDSESATIKPGMTVVVRGNRIESVAPDAAAKIPAGSQVIDAAGKTVMPGLWDMHVHLGGDDGLLNIANGVTSVRDLANDTDKLLAMRKSFDEGTAIGPRVVMAGIIDGPGPYAGPTKVLVDTPEAAKAAVDNYAKLGYVQIKIYSSVKPELVPVITAEAHKLGLRVSGHIPAFMTAEQAVNEGYNEIQHANFLALNFMFDEVKDTRTPARFTEVAKRTATLDLNSAPVQNFVKLLQERHITLDPTLNVFDDMFLARAGEVAPTLKEVADRLPVQVRRGALSGGLPVPEGMDQRYRDSFHALEKMVKMMYDAGIPIEAGTDSLAGFTLHSELELDVESGIPAPKVLQLATRGAAHIMSQEQVGVIAPGKLADIIVVNGRPDERMADIRKVETVIKDGVVYKPAELDEALGVRP